MTKSAMQYQILGEVYRPITQLPFKQSFAQGELVPIDLSVHNSDLSAEATSTLNGLTSYVEGHIHKHNAKGAWGGYGEKRDLYRRSAVFAKSDAYRNMHLGVDFWLPAGTEIAAPLPGEVHSFADNDSPGNYGPTIVLLHEVGNIRFHSLYGHLSRASLTNIKKGQIVRRGEVFATLGAPHENVDWPPHLHFQLVVDMQGMKGDYPGVCMENELDRYLRNCPNPLELLGWDL